MKRRDFVKLASLCLLPRLSWSTTQCSNMGKTLILVFLRGGVDGYRAVPPVSGPLSVELASLRPSLIHNQNEIIVPHQSIFEGHQYGIDSALGRLFNPNGGVVSPSDLRQVLDVGIPLRDATRSHKQAQDVVCIGNTKPGSAKQGWAGKLVDRCNLLNTQVFGFADIVGTPYLHSDETSILQAFSPDDLGFYNRWFGGYGCDTCKPGLLNDKYVSPQDDNLHALEVLRSLYMQHEVTSPIDQAASIADENLQSMIRLIDEVKTYQTVGDYRTRSEISNSGEAVRTYFRDCCKLSAQILKSWKANNRNKSQLLMIGLDGLDTHSNQKSALNQLLELVDGSLAGLVQDIKNDGLWNDVTIALVSEFGRKLNATGSGTDHGNSNNYLAFGGSVVGGISGSTPSERVGTAQDYFYVPKTSVYSFLKDCLDWAGFDTDNLFEELGSPSNYRSLFV